MLIATIRCSAGQEGLGLVQAMLEVAAFPEDSICAISFNFWHRLSRLLTSDPPGQLLQLLPAHQYLPSSCCTNSAWASSTWHHAVGTSYNCCHWCRAGIANGAHVDAALPPPPIPQHFLQAFEQLVNVVRGRVRYPDDFESWHRDDQDEFRRSRFAIGDTLLDAAGTLILRCRCGYHSVARLCVLGYAEGGNC